MFFRFGKWLRRFGPGVGVAAPRPCPNLRLLMYTRKDCHLCAEAWDLLVDQQIQRGFVLEKIDVDTDPDLTAKYGDCVPVVTVNGQVRFRGRINEVLLRRLFDAQA